MAGIMTSFSSAVMRGAVKVVARYRQNRPSSKSYNPSRGSFRRGRGSSVFVPKGGRIF